MLRRLANVILHGLLILFAVLTLVPFAYMVCGALKSKYDFAATLFLPAGDGWLGIGWDRLTLVNFVRLFTDLGLPRALHNSILLASVSSILTVLCCAMGGYALAKHRFRGRDTVMGLVLSALIIPGPLLLAPSFQLLYNLNLLDTYTGLILPGLAPAFGVFLFRQAMLNSVPDELLDSLSLCGDEGYVRERIQAFKDAGVTNLNINPIGADPVGLTAKIKEWVS